MAGKANKKQRHEAKRKAKRLAVRKAQSVSPMKRLSDGSGEIECWASRNFEAMGQIQVLVFKRAAGLTGIACFLIDRGVVGLKDSWVRVDVPRKEFQEMLDAGSQRGIMMERISIEKTRDWVAGGARWAYDNGMRLPKDWLKHTMLIGGVGTWQTVDVSQFAMEFAGHPEDLRQRLIGETIETFLERNDILFIFNEAAPYMDQRTGQYAPDADFGAFDDDDDDDDVDDEMDELDDESLEAFESLTQRVDATAKSLMAQTQLWLSERNETVSPELTEGWRAVLTSIMLAKSARPNATTEETSEVLSTLLEGQLEMLEPSQVATRRQAIEQALKHARADSSLLQGAARMLQLSSDAP